MAIRLATVEAEMRVLSGRVATVEPIAREVTELRGALERTNDRLTYTSEKMDDIARKLERHQEQRDDDREQERDDARQDRRDNRLTFPQKVAVGVTAGFSSLAAVTTIVEMLTK